MERARSDGRNCLNAVMNACYYPSKSSLPFIECVSCICDDSIITEQSFFFKAENNSLTITTVLFQENNPNLIGCIVIYSRTYLIKNSKLMDTEIWTKTPRNPGPCKLIQEFMVRNKRKTREYIK